VSWDEFTKSIILNYYIFNKNIFFITNKNIFFVHRDKFTSWRKLVTIRRSWSGSWLTGLNRKGSNSWRPAPRMTKDRYESQIYIYIERERHLLAIWLRDPASVCEYVLLYKKLALCTCPLSSSVHIYTLLSWRLAPRMKDRYEAGRPDELLKKIAQNLSQAPNFC
jgi:hypothetical protein